MQYLTSSPTSGVKIDMFFWSKKKQAEKDEEYQRQISEIRKPLLEKMDEANKSLGEIDKTLTKTKVRYITETIAHATGADRR